jgi:rubredoxin
MALQNINIDDRNFDQLLQELKQHIPVAKWTDHHPSDPGIMLLELFAWLGEMTLYTMNTVPPVHRQKFLKLIIDPPEPVTVRLELDFQVPGLDRPALEIPPGIRFATDFKNGERYVFETYKKTTFPEYIFDPEKEPEPIIIDTRSWKKITGEEIGITSEAPNQTFSLKPGQLPVLLDFVYQTRDDVEYPYLPNPVIHTDVYLCVAPGCSFIYKNREQATPFDELDDTWVCPGCGAAKSSFQPVDWQLKPFLLTKDSQVKDDTKHYHFMVEAFENTIRFGDNIYGSFIPNATLTCDYQVIQGKEALIKAGEIKHILNPEDIPLPPGGGAFSIKANDDAMSDLYFMEKENRLAKGLENFKKPYRLITDQDFEHALMTDFNTLQELTRRNPFNQLPDFTADYDIHTLKEFPGGGDYETLVQQYFLPAHLPPGLYKICRVSPLMNYRYIEPSGPLVPGTGHVTLLVIPEFNPDIPESQNQIEVPGALKDKILRFLDKRRLITTRLHIMPAQLKRIRIYITVVIFKERFTQQMKDTIRTHIHNFMDILTGGFDQKGWPTGGNLYKSHIYRLVEGIDGVDYVKSLTLSPAVDNNYIDIGENQLPLLEHLDIYPERG